MEVNWRMLREHEAVIPMKTKTIGGALLLMTTMLLGALAATPTASAHACSYDEDENPDACGDDCDDGLFHLHWERGNTPNNHDCFSAGPAKIPDTGGFP